MHHCKSILPLFLMACALTLQAQKPNPANPLEIKLAQEDAASHVVGNMRIADKTGHPLAIYQANYQVTPANPETMARQYLTANSALLDLRTDDLSNLKLHVVQNSQTGHTVRLRQIWKGLPVNKNAEITVHINTAGVVDFVMNGFQYGITLQDINPVLTANQAKQLVIDHLHTTGAITYEANELMVLHQQDKDFLVYRVTIVADQPIGEWEAYIDAKTGIVIKIEDISAYHHHEPELSVPPAFNPPTVNGTGFVFKPDPLTSATATYGATGYVDGSDANTTQLTAQRQSVTLLDITLTSGTYSLVGPYAEIRDFEAPNKGLFTQASSTFNFDRLDDAFEAVNTYYHIDNVMRYLNVTLGLTLLPYQYVGGVRFDPSGLSSADNSHYLSSSGQLAFGEGGVDDAEDADVIVHELGHGLHDWVTAGGLSQVNGLSEGTGDYMAGSYSRYLGYWTSGQTAYNWMFNWDGHNPFWSGRVLNYTAIYPSGLVNQIHTDGQIWATAMMHIWDDIGRQNADKAFWMGLQMTNSSTNQNDAANAVYQAAINMGYSFANRLAMHTRFTAAGYTMPAAPAPVELLRFDAAKAGEQVVLTWATANEVQNDLFTVEKSADGQFFEMVGQQKGAGTTQTNKQYTLTDYKPYQGINYYRLKQTDFDGASTYSKVVAVQFDGINNLELYPNPATESIVVRHTFSAGTISIYDATGKLMQTQSFEDAQGKSGTVIALSGMPQGMYWVHLVAEGQVMTGKVYKSE